jgi:hypothetical protein
LVISPFALFAQPDYEQVIVEHSFFAIATKSPSQSEAVFNGAVAECGILSFAGGSKNGVYLRYLALQPARPDRAGQDEVRRRPQGFDHPLVKRVDADTLHMLLADPNVVAAK